MSDLSQLQWKGWGYSSVINHLSSILKVQVFIPNIEVVVMGSCYEKKKTYIQNPIATHTHTSRNSSYNEENEKISS